MTATRPKEKSPRAGQGAEGSEATNRKTVRMNSLNTSAETQALLVSAVENLQHAAQRLQEVQAHLLLAAGALQGLPRPRPAPVDAFGTTDLDYARQIVREFGAVRREPWIFSCDEEGSAIDVMTHLDDVPPALARSLPRLPPPGRPVRIGRRQVRDARYIWRCRRAAYAISDLGELADVAAACRNLFARVPVSAVGGRA